MYLFSPVKREVCVFEEEYAGRRCFWIRRGLMYQSISKWSIASPLSFLCRAMIYLLWCLHLHLFCLLEFISTPNLECIASLSCVNVKFIIVVMRMNVEVICGSVLLYSEASVFYLVVKNLNHIYSLHYLLFRIKKPQSWIL